jgi:hypothetical protein
MHFLADASASFIPVTEETTTWVVQVMFLKLRKVYNYSIDTETAWMAIGLYTRLASIVGVIFMRRRRLM